MATVLVKSFTCEADAGSVPLGVTLVGIVAIGFPTLVMVLTDAVFVKVSGFATTAGDFCTVLGLVTLNRLRFFGLLSSSQLSVLAVWLLPVGREYLKFSGEEVGYKGAVICTAIREV